MSKRVVVVDTNVPIAANGSEDVSPECSVACIRALLEVLEDRQRLALDDNWLIIGEYRHKLSVSGQPGLGDAFLKWVLTNWANADRCQLVAVTPTGPEDFEEFPSEPRLLDFDPSDKKFVAVANAHPVKPPILQGLDSKWWGWKEALSAVGVNVEFLCPTVVAATYERKLRGRGSRAKRRRG